MEREATVRVLKEKHEEINALLVSNKAMVRGIMEKDRELEGLKLKLVRIEQKLVEDGQNGVKNKERYQAHVLELES